MRRNKTYKNTHNETEMNYWTNKCHNNIQSDHLLYYLPTTSHFTISKNFAKYLPGSTNLHITVHIPEFSVT